MLIFCHHVWSQIRHEVKHQIIVLELQVLLWAIDSIRTVQSSEKNLIKTKLCIHMAPGVNSALQCY